MKEIRKKAILFAALAALLFVVRGTAFAELTATANHDHIKIDFFYHGSSVSVRGVSDPCTDLIVKITAPEGHHLLKKKGKIAGFLWMNVGDLKFERVPNLYAVHSTRELHEILSEDEMDRNVIGYSALEKHIEITPVDNQEERGKWFAEFLKFKQSSNLYTASSGKLSVKEQDGKQNYYILLDWPYQATPGEYTVTVYAAKDRKIVDKTETKVFVEQAGLVETLSTMAKKNGALYGFISIMAALGAGFGVGMVFRKGGGAH
jgi:uncharacterized protein (TIGR02186 family)